MMHNSLWAQMMRPLHQMTYPAYLTYMRERTSRLTTSLATNGLAKTLVSGVSIGDLTQGISLPKGDESLQGLVSQVKDLTKTVDLSAISELLQTFDSEKLSAEEIDRLIATENAKRQSALKF